MNTIIRDKRGAREGNPLKRCNYCLVVTLYVALGLLLIGSPVLAEPVTSSGVFKFSGQAYYWSSDREEQVELAGSVHVVTQVQDPTDPNAPYEVRATAALQEATGIGLTTRTTYRAIDRYNPNEVHYYYGTIPGEWAGISEHFFYPEAPPGARSEYFQILHKLQFNAKGEVTDGSSEVFVPPL